MEHFTVNKIEYYNYDTLMNDYCCDYLCIDKFIYVKKQKGKFIKSDEDYYDHIFVKKNYFDKNFENIVESKIIAFKPIGSEITCDFVSDDISKCYFDAVQLSNIFGLVSIENNILNTGNNIFDYKYMLCPRTKTKKLFLTYNGILKVLYSSKNNKTKPFTSWATKTLFTAHLGTPQSKTKLASSLLGIDLASVKKFLSASPSALSVIYFIFIGYVKDVREKFNLDEDLDDNLMMCRYGYTDDLNIRIGQHKTKFGNQIELLLFNIIDSSFLSKAENSLDKYFESMDSLLDVKIKGNNETEVVVIEKTDIKNIKDQFELIGSKYEGKMSKQAEFIKDLITKHEKEIMVEKHKNELMIVRHQKEILEQKLEIAQLKAKIKK